MKASSESFSTSSMSSMRARASVSPSCLSTSTSVSVSAPREGSSSALSHTNAASSKCPSPEISLRIACGRGRLYLRSYARLTPIILSPSSPPSSLTSSRLSVVHPFIAASSRMAMKSGLGSKRPERVAWKRLPHLPSRALTRDLLYLFSNNTAMRRLVGMLFLPMSSEISFESKPSPTTASKMPLSHSPLSVSTASSQYASSTSSPSSRTSLSNISISSRRFLYMMPSSLFR
mmetsp:Transcript_18138/g.30303  ORF Transcript_18138/g.30303 Transcript_18138/m.30303 type:complete len:232 (-) Transcript_18138:692-1387(-)